MGTPIAQELNGKEKHLLVNPGSPTDPSSFLNKPSVGLLQITKKAIVPQIVEL